MIKHNVVDQSTNCITCFSIIQSKVDFDIINRGENKKEKVIWIIFLVWLNTNGNKEY